MVAAEIAKLHLSPLCQQVMDQVVDQCFQLFQEQLRQAEAVPTEKPMSFAKHDAPTTGKQCVLARRLALLLTAVALLALSITALVRWCRASSSPEQGLPHGAAWRVGTEYVYSLRYRSSDTVELGGEAAAAPGTGAGQGAADGLFAGSFELAGTLHLRAYGAGDRHQVIGLRLDDLARHEFRALGQDLLPTASAARQALVGHEALATVDESGRVRGLRFAAGAPPLFRQTISTLVGETLLELQRGRQRWTALERTQRGESQVSYLVTQLDHRRSTLQKTRGRYRSLAALPGDLTALDQNVDALAEIQVAAAGHLEAFAGKEHLDVLTRSGQRLVGVTTSTELRLLSVRPFATGEDALGKALARIQRELATRPLEQVAEIAESPEARTQVLTRIANGLTVEGVADQLRGQGALPRDFLWRGLGAARAGTGAVRGAGGALPRAGAQGRPAQRHRDAARRRRAPRGSARHP